MNLKSFTLLLVLTTAWPLNAAEPAPTIARSVLNLLPGAEAEDIREEDLRAGTFVSPASRLRQLINCATGYGNAVELKKANERKMRGDVNKNFMKEGPK